jgi:hypothetical protein
MNCPCQAFWRLALCAAALMGVFPAPAQVSTNPPVPVKIFSTPTNLIPPAPQSPVSVFRRLLAMTPSERTTYLTNRMPEIRGQILAKVSEYLALEPDERELRLDATELRWYLLPLLRESPTNRAARLAQVPDNLRELVGSRLKRWDALPAQSRQEFLGYDAALFFARIETTNPATANVEQQKIAEQFNKFFDFTPEERQKAINTLSAAEHAQMEKTLQAFDNLPPAQRAQCIRAFTEFASMSPSDRQEFLKNAERWSQLPPKERQAWRDLVAQVPLWPPLPRASIMPPKPPPPPRPPAPSPPPVRSMMATNQN